MTEQELQIGKNFGPYCFFIYQALKLNPYASIRDLEADTGLSDKNLSKHLKTLYDCNIVTRKSTVLEQGGSDTRGYIYAANEKHQEAWTLH